MFVFTYLELRHNELTKILLLNLRVIAFELDQIDFVSVDRVICAEHHSTSRLGYNNSELTDSRSGTISFKLGSKTFIWSQRVCGFKPLARPAGVCFIPFWPFVMDQQNRSSNHEWYTINNRCSAVNERKVFCKFTRTSVRAIRG